MKTTLTTIIEPALFLLPPRMTSNKAIAMMLAIGMPGLPNAGDGT